MTRTHSSSLTAVLTGSTLVAALAAARPADAQTFPASDRFTAFTCGNAPMSDGVRDQAGAVDERDLVGTAASPAGLSASDDGFLYLRLRLDDDPRQGMALRPFAWGYAFSTDADPTTYEVLATVDGDAETVRLYRNTTTTMVDRPEDPADTPAFASYPFASHGRVVAAGSLLGDDDDYFIDFALPWTDLQMVGITRDADVVVWAASSTVADRLNGDFACHAGGGADTVPPLSDADGDRQRAVRTGAGGSGGAGGAAGGSGAAGASTTTIEGGPGCELASSGGDFGSLGLLLASLVLARRRSRY